MRTKITLDIDHTVAPALLAVAAVYEGDDDDKESVGNEAINACFWILSEYADNEAKFDLNLKTAEVVSVLSHISIYASRLEKRLKEKIAKDKKELKD